MRKCKGQTPEDRENDKIIHDFVFNRQQTLNKIKDESAQEAKVMEPGEEKERCVQTQN